MHATRIATAICWLLLPAAAFGQIAPGPPQNLAQLVSGTTVTLTWSPPAIGATPTGYVVEASVVPGGPLVASLQVLATTLTVPNVPTGVYYVRVRALNGGVAGAPSNEITVAVSGGCPAPPLPPQLIVRSAGLAVTLNWSSSGGCAPTSYVVLAGSAPGLANIAQVNLGGQTGLAATAPAGTYFVRVIGTNAFGSAISEEMTLRVAPNNITDTILPGDALFLDVSFTQSGTYKGTLVWNDASIDLDLYLTTAGCPYPPTGCTVAISDRTGVNLEEVALPVRPGDVYRIWVDNFANRATSFTITNTLIP
jgi:Fibronectin type III domain